MMGVIVNSNINKFLETLNREVEKATKEATDLLLRESQLTVPIDTGALKESGYSKKQGPLSYQAGYETAYASIVEYRQGFFRRSLIENERRIIDEVFNGVVKATKSF